MYCFRTMFKYCYNNYINNSNLSINSINNIETYNIDNSRKKIWYMKNGTIVRCDGSNNIARYIEREINNIRYYNTWVAYQITSNAREDNIWEIQFTYESDPDVKILVKALTGMEAAQKAIYILNKDLEEMEYFTSDYNSR